MSTDDKDATKSVTATALVPIAEEFAKTSAGAGAKLGQAAQHFADSALVAAQTVSVLLLPLQGVVWSYNQIKDKLIPRLATKIRTIPEDRLQPPPISLAGPVIEAAKYLADEEILVDMFAELLATSMDRETSHRAHPSFVEIVKQMMPAEARLIQVLGEHPYKSWAALDLRSRLDHEGAIAHKTYIYNFSLLGDIIGESDAEKMQAYIDNLLRLELISCPADINIADENAYDEVEKHPTVEDFRQAVKKMGRTVFLRQGLIRLTAFGRLFCLACLKAEMTA